MYFASQNVHLPDEGFLVFNSLQLLISFLILQFFIVPAEYEEYYKNIKDENRRKLLGMVSLLDSAVGNMTKALKRFGLLDDTIIFFTSDVITIP